MALFAAAAARRAATSSLSLLRASVSRAGIPLRRPLAAAAARPMPFSSAAGVRPSSDNELPRVIKAETKLNDPESSSSARNQEDESKNHPKQHDRRISWVHQMNDDSSVKFSCTANFRERTIVINALALRPPPPWDHESDEEADFTDSEEDDVTESEKVDLSQHEEVHFSESDEVVEFSKLDVKLQHALYELAKPLGLYTPEITELSQEQTLSEDRARHLFWETKLWDFLNKFEPDVKPPPFSPFKITNKGLEVMSRDEALRMASSALKFAANCGDRNRDQDDKKDIENLQRYLTQRGVPKLLQENIINKL